MALTNSDNNVSILTDGDVSLKEMKKLFKYKDLEIVITSVWDFKDRNNSNNSRCIR